MIATVIGATGMIGMELVQQLLNDDTYKTVRVLIRRPMSLTHPKLEKKIVDFSDGDSLLIALTNTDVLFCAIGTTQNKVKGNKEEYRKIDHDIPVNIARYCKMIGCEKFVLVSSVGANRSSNNFYLKLKGEIEDNIRATGLRSIHVMRPSLLMGDRKESRPTEKIAMIVMPALSFLFPAKYKPVHARHVASKMVVASKNSAKGFFVYEGNELSRY